MLRNSKTATPAWPTTYFGEPGLLTADKAELSFITWCGTSRKCELTFLGYAFERLGGAFDPVLAVVSVCRKQADHFVGSARGRTCNVAGGKIDGLSDTIFMTQRPLHTQKRQLPPSVPLASAD
jgi:hypothetical protein